MNQLARVALCSLLASAFSLSGCVAFEAAQHGVGLYNNVKGATGAYHASTMVKDLKNATPVFAGYNSVLILADIAPRESNPHVATAFAGNMAMYAASVARTVRAPLQGCLTQSQCYGRTVIVQFKEDAYDRNLVQRFTIGDKIRGKLYFMDAASGRILDEKRIEGADDYAALCHLTSIHLVQAMFKSYEQVVQAEGPRIHEELERIPFVFPQYASVLGKAS